MNNTDERVTLFKTSSNDLESMKPLIRSAFESSLIDGIGHVDESMLPGDELNDMLMMPDMIVYKAMIDDQLVGGVIVKINETTYHNVLELFFVDSSHHSHGVGLKIWKALETLYPDTKVWETETPEFSKRNIHFYVNKCGFHIVEYFNEHHPYPNPSGADEQNDMENVPYGMYLFKKYMKGHIV